VIAAAVGGYFAQHQTSSTPKGSITLPRTLLSLPRATSAAADRLARNLRNSEATHSHGRLWNIMAGIYGSPTGAWLAIAAGGICGTCYAKSTSVVERGLVRSGYSGVRAFPAGSKGGSLACGSRQIRSGTLLHCIWVDKMTAGDVLFAPGSASGLAEAAAKTNQVRAAVEH